MGKNSCLWPVFLCALALVTCAPLGPENLAPTLSLITSDPELVYPGDSVALSVNAVDPDGDTLVFLWSATGGDFGRTDTSHTVWRAPSTAADYTVTVSVSDGNGHETTQSKLIKVLSSNAPAVSILVPAADADLPNLAGEELEIKVKAEHQNGIEKLTLIFDSDTLGNVSRSANVYSATVGLGRPAGRYRIKAVAAINGVPPGADSLYVNLRQTFRPKTGR